METCNAIARSTGERCKSTSAPGSRYCFLHMEKKSKLLSVFVGAIVGAGISFLITWVYQTWSPDSTYNQLKNARKEIASLKEEITKLTETAKASQDLLKEMRILQNGDVVLLREYLELKRESLVTQEKKTAAAAVEELLSNLDQRVENQKELGQKNDEIAAFYKLRWEPVLLKIIARVDGLIEPLQNEGIITNVTRSDAEAVISNQSSQSSHMIRIIDLKNGSQIILQVGSAILSYGHLENELMIALRVGSPRNQIVVQLILFENVSRFRNYAPHRFPGNESFEIGEPDHEGVVNKFLDSIDSVFSVLVLEDQQRSSS